MDLNNLFLGANPTSSLGTAFPGEFDDFKLYDFPLGIFEPLEAEYPGPETRPQWEDVYPDPTIAEFYLGSPSLNEDHRFFDLFAYPDMDEPSGWDPDVLPIPYQAAEFASALGLVALQDNGDLTLLGGSVGNFFSYDPMWHFYYPGPPTGEYLRRSCDPRLLYGNAQVAAGMSHLLVLKTNGVIWQQKFGWPLFQHPQT